MIESHQLIIDCGLNNSSICQLNKDSLEGIKLSAYTAPAQYNYYLLFNNHFKQNCQINSQAQLKEQKKSNPLSAINLKIFYQNLQLFNDNLSSFFSKEIDFLSLEAQSSKLYRLEFYLAELNEDFEVNFDLNFYLDCQKKQPEEEKNEPNVLALQDSVFQETLIEPKIEVKENLSQEKTLLITILIAFFLFFLIIVLFWRLKIKNSKKY
jgi:hypothetical protein